MHIVVTGGFDGAVKVFRERIQRDGILRAIKEREAYVKPGEKRRRKIFLAASRRKKAQRRWEK